MRHNVSDLMVIFDKLFVVAEATCLRRGGTEPNYEPASQPGGLHRILFAHGFFSSALHEVAHWCIAGRARRQLPDYGYWYHPDGRSPEQQQEFARVEVKPQALEWIFAAAAGAPFHASADNLSADGAATAPDWQAFQRAVAAQARAYTNYGLPPRAAVFATALSQFYATGTRWRDAAVYCL